jgi:hypothetical protein
VLVIVSKCLCVYIHKKQLSSLKVSKYKLQVPILGHWDWKPGFVLDHPLYQTPYNEHHSRMCHYYHPFEPLEMNQ